MKAAITLVCSLVSVLPMTAAEFVTLTPTTSSKAVSSTDLVEVVGTTMNNNGTALALRLTFADDPGDPIDLVLRGKEVSAGVPAAFNDMKGNSFTGLTSVALLTGPNKAAVTLKITPAEELSVASEGTVLVVPDSTEGDLTVLVESSNDMVTWSSFLSQNITAGSSPKFYRTRIIKNVSP